MMTVPDGPQAGSSEEVQQHISWLLRANEPTPTVGDYLTDPKVRPPFDYATLCAKAILSCPDQQGTLTDLYAYISGNFPYYAQSWACWQNSIRHTLSHHKCFVRVEGPSRDGRNKHCRYWTIAADQRNLFTEDGVYVATTSRRRMRNVKDSSGQLIKKGKSRASVTAVDRKPSLDQQPKLAALPAASPAAPPLDAYAPALYDTAGTSLVFQWPPADALQTHLWAASPKQTVTPHALSPVATTPSPLPFSMAGFDVGGLASPVQRGLWSAQTYGSLPGDEASLLLDHYFGSPPLPATANDVDWSAVACMLGLET